MLCGFGARGFALSASLILPMISLAESTLFRAPSANASAGAICKNIAAISIAAKIRILPLTFRFRPVSFIYSS
jgi:hypothetical protein